VKSGRTGGTGGVICGLRVSSAVATTGTVRQGASRRGRERECRVRAQSVAWIAGLIAGVGVFVFVGLRGTLDCGWEWDWEREWPLHSTDAGTALGNRPVRNRDRDCSCAISTPTPLPYSRRSRSRSRLGVSRFKFIF
jgi:hypothetical protein